MTVDVGQEAPDFEVKGTDGEIHKLSDHRGKDNVVLVFHPFAFTGICQDELCSLRDDIARFEAANAQVYGVSCDSTHAQKKWAEEQGYNFPLLSDFWPHGGVARSYGVFDEKLGIATRGTFIIDKDGVVRWKIVNPIPQARDIADYQKALASL